jgi:hypothetical protein
MPLRRLSTKRYRLSEVDATLEGARTPPRRPTTADAHATPNVDAAEARKRLQLPWAPDWFGCPTTPVAPGASRRRSVTFAPGLADAMVESAHRQPRDTLPPRGFASAQGATPETPSEKSAVGDELFRTPAAAVGLSPLAPLSVVVADLSPIPSAAATPVRITPRITATPARVTPRITATPARATPRITATATPLGRPPLPHAPRSTARPTTRSAVDATPLRSDVSAIGDDMFRTPASMIVAELSPIVRTTPAAPKRGPATPFATRDSLGSRLEHMLAAVGTPSPSRHAIGTASRIGSIVQPSKLVRPTTDPSVVLSPVAKRVVPAGGATAPPSPSGTPRSASDFPVSSILHPAQRQALRTMAGRAATPSPRAATPSRVAAPADPPTPAELRDLSSIEAVSPAATDVPVSEVTAATPDVPSDAATPPTAAPPLIAVPEARRKTPPVGCEQCAALLVASFTLRQQHAVRIGAAEDRCSWLRAAIAKRCAAYAAAGADGSADRGVYRLAEQLFPLSSDGA